MKVKSLTPLYSAGELQERVRELAGEINTLYDGEPLVMICVLKGAFMFFADLLKHVTVRPEIDFVRLASYGSAMASSRDINFSKDVETPLEGKHVLVVEDVVDSGVSMEYLLRELGGRGARSLRLMALVDKSERRERRVPIDFSGFSLSGGFIVGYGLDCAERFRELPAIYVLELED